MKTQVSLFFDHIVLWAFQVFIGVGTKLAIESRTREITKKYLLTSFIIASFVGYITDKLCTKWGMDDMRGVAVSIMALLSESILRYLMENSDSIMNAILRRNLNIDLSKGGADAISVKSEKETKVQETTKVEVKVEPKSEPNA